MLQQQVLQGASRLPSSSSSSSSFEGHPLQARHKQNWGRGFILLLPQTAALPGSELPWEASSPLDSVPEKIKFVENTSDHENFLSYVNMHDLSKTDCCIAYPVSGYIARSISRRRKWQSCRDLLIKYNDMLSLDNFIFNERAILLKLADREGLAVHSNYCFAVCALAVQAYYAITFDADANKILM